MFGACAGWGLMSPVGKDAMLHGFDGITMVSFRVAGACLLFWIASLFAPKEQVPWRDRLMFIGAALTGLLFNQCCFTIGLSITSPINASIVTTSMPIFAMILAALILREPITGKKALGVLMGCSGALILILSSAAHADARVGDIRGDLLCLFAQFSFALYLSLFNPLIKRYNVFTVNKYMFSWATLMLLPLSSYHVYGVISQPIPLLTWIEVGYVVVCGTFFCYILTMIGQRTLRPTVVSVYNYVQPIVAVAASLIMMANAAAPLNTAASPGTAAASSYDEFSILAGMDNGDTDIDINMDGQFDVKDCFYLMAYDYRKELEPAIENNILSIADFDMSGSVDHADSDILLKYLVTRKKAKGLASLIARGYEREIATEALEATLASTPKNVEEESLKKDFFIAKNKFLKFEDLYIRKQKIFAYLARKGYKYEDIKRVIEEEYNEA